MSKAFYLSFFVVCSSLSAMVRAGVEYQTAPENDDGTVYYYEQDVWYGPGFYNGIWFGSEGDFDDWNYYHHHGYPHYYRGGHYHGGHYHGGGYRGGGHRGGGHGGGGHGGGGHHR